MAILEVAATERGTGDSWKSGIVLVLELELGGQMGLPGDKPLS
jgi:hypothetical protein